MKILFVCTGNTCRSPMAEGILKSKVTDKKVEVYSAGIFAAQGSPVSYQAVEALKEKGIDISHYRSTPVDALDLGAMDLILTMTVSHKAWLLEKYPSLGTSVYTIKEFNSMQQEGFKDQVETSMDIMDPFGGSIPIYRKCAGEIEKNIERLILFLDTDPGLSLK